LLLWIWIFWKTVRDVLAPLLRDIVKLLPDGEVRTTVWTPRGTDQPVSPLLNSLFWMMPPL
jgi:hypothetical protein